MSLRVKRFLIIASLLSYIFLPVTPHPLTASEASPADSPLPAGSAKFSAPTLSIEGQATSTEGEPFAGVSVWAASYDSPGRHLAETATDGEGIIPSRFPFRRSPEV